MANPKKMSKARKKPNRWTRADADRSWGKSPHRMSKRKKHVHAQSFPNVVQRCCHESRTTLIIGRTK